MVELLTSSSTSTISNDQENEPTTISDSSTANPAPVHSKVLRRRIVNMLEALRRRGGTTPPSSTSPKLTSSPMGSKSQPITFGQLRQATTTPVSTTVPTPPSPISTTEESSTSKISTARSYNDLLSVISDNRSATSMPAARSLSRHAASTERLFYSPSLEQLLEQHTINPRKNEQTEIKPEEEQQAKPPLTVDEILATYYSKVKVPTATDTNPSLPLTSYPHPNMGFYIGSSSTEWHSSQTNPYHPRPLLPTQLVLNEPNRNRPPPPSYSFSVTSGHRQSSPTS